MDSISLRFQRDFKDFIAVQNQQIHKCNTSIDITQLNFKTVKHEYDDIITIMVHFLIYQSWVKEKKMQLYHNGDWKPLGLCVPISVTHDIHHILRGAKGAEVEN